MTLYRFGKTAAVAGIAAVALGGLLVMSGRGQAFDSRTRRRPGFEESAGARNSPGAAELVREGQSPGRTWKLHHECRVRLQLLPHVEPWCGICVWQKPLLTGAASREGQSGSLPGWRKRFGTLDPDGLSAHIISRNLTPDKTGLPEGGTTFEGFLEHMRHGKDEDLWHPTCTGALGPHCVPPPFDGTKLQIMPWPTYAKMSDHDLRAIYEYLSAIPCLEGDPGNICRCRHPRPSLQITLQRPGQLIGDSRGAPFLIS